MSFFQSIKLSVSPFWVIVAVAVIVAIASCATPPESEEDDPDNTIHQNPLPYVDPLPVQSLGANLNPQVPSHDVLSFGSCDEAEKYLQKAAIEAMGIKVLQLMNAENQMDTDWSSADTDTDTDMDSDSDSDSDGDMDMDTDTDTDTDTDSDSDSDADGDVTGTNNQETGVDEADIVKTDGDYYYILNSSELVLVRQTNGFLEIEGRSDVSGSPKEMFLRQDTVVAISDISVTDVPVELRHMVSPNQSFWNEQPDSGYTRISILDVSDKTNPTIIREITYAGNYKTSRLIDNGLRVVITSPLPALHTGVDINDVTQDNFEALVARNVAQIEAVAFGDVLPKKLDQIIGAEPSAVEVATRCTDMYAPTTPSGIALTTVVSLDLNSPATKQRDVLLFADTGHVYASTKSLYIATSNEYVRNAVTVGLWTEETSGIHKFDIENNPGLAIYEASGEVTGHLLDQFCMGEHNDFLRVASSTFLDGLDNHLTVLEQDGSSLVEAARLDGVGAGEDLYSARFTGDRGYMLTFMDWVDTTMDDPLFTFDLSDPYNPRIIGEWHGPGFGTYMHPLGDNHLIAVGYEDGWPHVSLFDLTNFANPTLAQREMLADPNLIPVAIEDHKAFTYSESRNILALPFANWSADQTGILLFDLDTTHIQPLETMPHMNEETSPVQRAMFNGNNLFSISRCRMTSAATANPTQIIDTIALYEGTCQDAL